MQWRERWNVGNVGMEGTVECKEQWNGGEQWNLGNRGMEGTEECRKQRNGGNSGM